MNTPSTYKSKFKELKCCVLIPTYNNERTVKKVIQEVLEYTDDLIVVNDGSTDSTPQILSSLTTIQLVTFKKNRGKGIALREGFKYAIAKGYDYAITLDSDGQHFAHDIPTLIHRLEKEKNILIIGARNMNQASVPGKSSFGNKFSSFWYWVITGIRLPDTQSGFRLYPIGKYKNMKFFTGKFEFEIEVMVRSAWADINVTSEPVSVYYGSDRVSHFRPGPDVFRITLLNTLFVLVSFLIVRPVKLIFNLGKKKFWLEVKKSIVGSEESNVKKALSVAFGIFFGIVPIWGFQLAVGIPLAIFCRLNVAIAVASANISFPPLNILIMYLSYKFGAYFVSNPSYDLILDYNLTHHDFLKFLNQFLIGGTLLAILSAFIFGIITWILLSIFRKNPVIAKDPVQSNQL
jgi:glycosyltransferase involved in cell wall biosynthesis